MQQKKLILAVLFRMHRNNTNKKEQLNIQPRGNAFEAEFSALYRGKLSNEARIVRAVYSRIYLRRRRVEPRRKAADFTSSFDKR